MGDLDSIAAVSIAVKRGIRSRVASAVKRLCNRVNRDNGGICEQCNQLFQDTTYSVVVGGEQQPELVTTIQCRPRRVIPIEVRMAI